jgi:hypothetical protein
MAASLLACVVILLLGCAYSLLHSSLYHRQLLLFVLHVQWYISESAPIYLAPTASWYDYRGLPVVFVHLFFHQPGRHTSGCLFSRYSVKFLRHLPYLGQVKNFLAFFSGKVEKVAVLLLIDQRNLKGMK